MRRWKIGDRVWSDILGAGRVVCRSVGRGLQDVTVLWDKRPPKEYNKGQNPSTIGGEVLEPEDMRERLRYRLEQVAEEKHQCLCEIDDAQARLEDAIARAADIAQQIKELPK